MMDVLECPISPLPSGKVRYDLVMIRQSRMFARLTGAGCVVALILATACRRPGPVPISGAPGTPPGGPVYVPIVFDDTSLSASKPFAQRWQEAHASGDWFYGAMRWPDSTGTSEFVDDARRSWTLADSQGIYIPVPGSRERVIAVHLPRDDDVQHPKAMELCLCSLVRTPSGATLPTPGVPYIDCYLSPDQARRVIAADVPADLILAMDQAGSVAGWQAMPNGVAFRAKHIEIDPLPYFPPMPGNLGNSSAASP